MGNHNYMYDAHDDHIFFPQLMRSEDSFVVYLMHFVCSSYNIMLLELGC